jgi:hypothetical protein
MARPGGYPDSIHALRPNEDGYLGGTKTAWMTRGATRANKAPRTIESYLEAVRLFDAFLVAIGMPFIP